MPGLILLVQAAILSMALDSTRVVGDSVEFRASWGYDVEAPAPVIDTLRVFWGKVPSYQKTRKLTNRATTSLTVRYPQRQGLETVMRWFCVRYYQRKVPVIRCVNSPIRYPIRLVITPDSVAFEIQNGVPVEVYPP